MRLPSLMLLALFLVAGCTDPEGTQTTSSDAPLPGIRFTSPVVVGQGSEPGLLIANDTLWAHAPGHLWRSDDGGGNWTTVAPGPALAVFGNDAEMVRAEDGTLYYSDLQLLTSISVYTSTDDGATWAYHPIGSVVPGVDRQWMATGPDAGPLAGAHHAVYLAFNQLGSSPWVTKSTDGGQTWTGRLVDPTQSQADFWTIGNLVVDPRSGTVYITWALGFAGHGLGPEPPTTDYRIKMAKSMDGGLTWQVSTILDPEGSAGFLFPVLAQDDLGLLHLAWSQDMGGHQEVRMMSSNDQGATWSTPVRVNQHNGTAVMPWIDARGGADVAVVWYGTDQQVLSDDATGEWYVYMARSNDSHLTGKPVFQETKVWDEPIRVGPICTLGVACTEGRDLADFFQVRLDGMRLAHVVFADSEHGDGTTTYYARQLHHSELPPPQNPGLA